MKRNVLAATMSRVLLCALVVPASFSAAAAEAPADASPDPKQLDSVVVQADIAYRNRTESVAPVLSYDLEYFQRFEPLTVGDMLKRVPSVAFVSDVLEYDGAQLRGLDPGYTQILINGKKVPGAATTAPSSSTASRPSWSSASRSSAAPARTAPAMRSRAR